VSDLRSQTTVPARGAHAPQISFEGREMKVMQDERDPVVVDDDGGGQAEVVPTTSGMAPLGAAS
jgi:hypothetical protein